MHSREDSSQRPDGSSCGGVGVLGDVHLHLPELRATLAGPLAGCTSYVCTGDFLDRGPGDPREVLRHLLDVPVQLLAGNHELAYLGGPAFAGMADDRSHVVAEQLRELVLDGRLRAGAAVGDVLCVHGGVTHAFWKRHLARRCGDDVREIATVLNRWLLDAVARRDFSHPAFAALGDRRPGPFWARFDDDLVAGRQPPLRQAVGHVVAWPPRWHEDARSGGAVFPLDWGSHHPERLIGHLVVRSSTGRDRVGRRT